MNLCCRGGSCILPTVQRANEAVAILAFAEDIACIVQAGDYFKIAICGYYWNMPPSWNNRLCGTTALTEGNDYDRLANVMLINEEDEEDYDLFYLVIRDNLGDVSNPTIRFVGENRTLTLDTKRAQVEFDDDDNTVVRMFWPIEDVLDALIPGDKVLALSYTAGGHEINMKHIMLPLPEEWLRKYQKTK